MSPAALLFTDLDGTLLDHETYGFDAARPALREVHRRGLPLILTTSKTLAEVVDINRALHNSAPVIIENGGAVGFPLDQAYPFELPAHRRIGDYAVVSFSPPYGEIRQFIETQREQQGFALRGFGDMTPSEVARHTGLAQDEAVQARERLCSEPFLWDGDLDDLERFRAAAEAAGLRVTAGGRFHHLMGETSKAAAMQTLHRLYDKTADTPSLVIALGDSENDREMLEQADIAVVVMRPDGNHLTCRGRQRTLQTHQPGPTGWNDAVEQIMGELDAGIVTSEE